MKTDMQEYIGTKRINAVVMSRAEYTHLRGWEVPDDEDGSDIGYLVEYLDGGAPNHPGFKGYISWSPMEVFHKAYKTNGKLTFGDAIEYLKLGKKVAREGWNGKGMFVSMTHGKTLSLDKDNIWTENVRKVAEDNGGKVDLQPYLVMKTAQNTIQIGWLATQSDMLSSDWYVL
jgi:hypothetical protein